MGICQVREACDPHWPIRGLPWDFICGLQETEAFFCCSFQIVWWKSGAEIVWWQTSLILFFPFDTVMYDYMKGSRVWKREEEKTAKRIREKWGKNSGRKREPSRIRHMLWPVLAASSKQASATLSLLLCFSSSCNRTLTSSSPSETTWLVIFDFAGSETIS